ncbi:hypothetical protein [Streptomyces sp. NPDC059080]
MTATDVDTSGMVLIPAGQPHIGAPEDHLDVLARSQHYGRS